MAYTAPDVAALVTRYPAFAAVPVSTVEMYLADAGGAVDESWTETDYAPAIAAYAAHLMALAGIGAQTQVGGYAAAGVRSIRSGSFSVDLAESAVSAASGGGLKSTPYGRAYLTLLKRNKGGPRLVGGAVAYADGWGDFGGIQNDGLLP